MNNTAFPIRPFDGQIFIDAQRVRWIFNAEERCWERDGVVKEIPIATTAQPGLLSAQLKQLIDSIPPKGGHFGIVVRPLLSVVPLHHETLLRDKVEHAFKTESGSTIRSQVALQQALEEDAYAGKLIRFTTGILKDTVFLIAGNNDSELRILGDASKAKYDDKFEIIEPTALNLNGIIAGDIELVSESIDISCVDADDVPISNECKNADSVIDTKIPAIDFKVSDIFKTQFCVQQPGCEGPRGDKGAKGKRGKDGTGDGPQGDDGDPGIDAPQTPFTLDGIKIIDIDDIYDTAVVAIEVDAANGRLNVVKAKMHTPDNNTPASQLIASEVFRSIEFTGNGFDFIIKKPNVDPIGSDDVKLGYYPQGFDVPADSLINRPLTTVVSTMNLSEFVRDASKYWQKKLDEINQMWDDQIREFIQNKDKEARTVLAQLCQQLAECEWERPIEFCLGLNSGGCGVGVIDIDSSSSSSSSSISSLGMSNSSPSSASSQSSISSLGMSNSSPSSASSQSSISSFGMSSSSSSGY
ncbi:MAG: hypothetical protein QXU32_01940 [Nitrososphaerales archaeon]